MRLIECTAGRQRFDKFLRRLLFIGTSRCTDSVRSTLIEKLTLPCNQFRKSELLPRITSLLVKILIDHAERVVEDPLKAFQLHEETFLSFFAHQNANPKANITKRQIIFQFLSQILKKAQLRHIQNLKQ